MFFEPFSGIALASLLVLAIWLVVIIIITLGCRRDKDD